MPETNSDWVFSRGIAINRDRVFLATFPGGEKPIGVTQIVRWTPNGVGNFLLPWEAKAISYLTHPEPHGLIMSPFGQIRISSPHGDEDELIEFGDQGPSRFGVLRDLQAIGKHAYAVGMNRQCYRRECGVDSLSNVAWVRYDDGVLNSGPPERIVGFNSIGGFSETDLYAVGWGGEIWNHDGRRWRQCQSVTNLKLERVVCAENGRVFAVGQAGVIVSGLDDQWEVIDQSTTSDQFWGATWFRDQLWVATHSNVYLLDDGGRLKEVELSSHERLTYGWLMTAENILWSIGLHHVFFSEDGHIWTQLFL